MRFLRSAIGYAIAGMFVMSVWGAFATPYGIAGGYLAAIIIIAPMWYMNHYVGLIHHDDDSSFVDMALGIAIAGTMRDTFMIGGSALIDSLPTLGLVAVGAVLGGLTAGLIEKDMAKKNPVAENVEKLSA